jgi:hypothetical protein
VGQEPDAFVRDAVAPPERYGPHVLAASGNIAQSLITDVAIIGINVLQTPTFHEQWVERFVRDPGTERNVYAFKRGYRVQDVLHPDRRNTLATGHDKNSQLGGKLCKLG